MKNGLVQSGKLTISIWGRCQCISDGPRW